MSNKAEIPTVEVYKHYDIGKYPFVLSYTILKHSGMLESVFKIGIYPLRLSINASQVNFDIRILLFKLAIGMGVSREY